MNLTDWILPSIIGGIFFEVAGKSLALPLLWGLVRQQARWMKKIPIPVVKSIITVLALLLLIVTLWATHQAVPVMPHYDLSAEETLNGDREARDRQIEIWYGRRVALKAEFAWILFAGLAFGIFGAVRSATFAALEKPRKTDLQKIGWFRRMARQHRRFLNWAYSEKPPVGILAYGSLITDPGRDIAPLIQNYLPMQTPFKIEFARSSSGRSGAPTLVPVDNGGSHVLAQLMVLGASVDAEIAEDLLYCREIDQVGSGKTYPRDRVPKSGQVQIVRSKGLTAADPVLYTKIDANLKNPTADVLADLAIESARGDAGTHGRDGITYLRDAKNAGISTPLMASYESEILRRTGASTLGEAIDLVTSRRDESDTCPPIN